MPKKINLEEIRSDIFTNPKYPLKESDFDKLYEYNYIIKDAMLEFGKQILELAAENANLIEHWENSDTKYIENSFCNFDEDGNLQNVIYANKQSILDTIKQVE